VDEVEDAGEVRRLRQPLLLQDGEGRPPGAALRRVRGEQQRDVHERGAGLDQRPPEAQPVAQDQTAPQPVAGDLREDRPLEEGEAECVRRPQNVRRLERAEELGQRSALDGGHGQNL
jgi:hypothetical protein